LPVCHDFSEDRTASPTIAGCGQLSLKVSAVSAIRPIVPTGCAELSPAARTMAVVTTSERLARPGKSALQKEIGPDGPHEICSQ